MAGAGSCFVMAMDDVRVVVPMALAGLRLVRGHEQRGAQRATEGDPVHGDLLRFGTTDERRGPHVERLRERDDGRPGGITLASLKAHQRVHGDASGNGELSSGLSAVLAKFADRLSQSRRWCIATGHAESLAHAVSLH